MGKNIHKARKKMKDPDKPELVEEGIVKPEEEEGKSTEEQKEQETMDRYFFGKNDLEREEQEVETKDGTKDKVVEKVVDKKTVKKDKENEEVVEEKEEGLTLDEIEEEVEKVVSPEKPTEEEDGKPEDEETKTQLTFSETAKSSLDRFQGNTQEKVEQLVKSYNSLLTQYETLKGVENLVSGLELEKELNSQDVIDLFKETVTLLDDIKTMPELPDIISGIYSGKVPDALQPYSKSVKDFMPEDEIYSHEDAVTDPSSLSWKAREAWESDRNSVNAKRTDFVEKLRKKQKDSKPKTPEAVAVALKSIKENTENLKVFAKNEYDLDDGKFGAFIREFSSFSLDTMKVVFAVWAKMNNVEHKIERKLKENKDKVSIEENIRSEEDIPGEIDSDISSKEDKFYDESFAY